MRTAASRLGLGRLAYRLWYQPRASIRRISDLGPLEMFRAARGRAAMRRALERLTPPQSLLEQPSGEASIHLFTGARFADMTAACVWSLAARADAALNVRLWDDGSLRRADGEFLRAVLGPRVQITTASEIGHHLDRHLPASRFPTLRARRGPYFNIRKLTDVHPGNEGWRLVLDSDMLFHSRPNELLDWLAKPERPLLMSDIATAYGRSTRELEEICGAPVAERLNVGVCGLCSPQIDWDQLEEWHRRLLETRSSYFDEQALLAMMSAHRTPELLPADSYVCFPSDAESRRPAARMHHYVDRSRLSMFRHGWRAALAPESGVRA